MEAVLVVRGFGSRAVIPGEPIAFLQLVFGEVRAARIMAGMDRNYGVLIGGVA